MIKAPAMWRSEQELLSQAVKGNEDALEELLQRAYEPLREQLAGKVSAAYRSVIEVEDVLQVTIIEAFLRIQQFRPVTAGFEAFLGWLKRIAENNVVDAVRRLEAARRPPIRKRVVAGANGDSYSTLLAKLSGSQTTPSQSLAREEDRALLEWALDRLPPVYAKAVRLCELEELPPAQVAQRMECTVGAVHMMNLRAKDRLREILKVNPSFAESSDADRDLKQ